MLYVLKQQCKLRARRALLNPQFLLQGFGLFLGFCGGLLGLFQFGAVSFLLCPFGGLAGLVCGFCFTPYRVDFRVPFGLADFLGGGLFSFPPGCLESFFLLGFGFFQRLAVLLPQGFKVCRRFGFRFGAGLVGCLFQLGFNVYFLGFCVTPTASASSACVNAAFFRNSLISRIAFCPFRCISCANISLLDILLKILALSILKYQFY